MSIASQITTMQEHIEDIYDTFAVAGVDTSAAAKNIVNINANLKERLEYYLANGLDVVWNNWNKISGSGTTLSLNNTIQAKMDFVYKGNTSQSILPSGYTQVDYITSDGNSYIDTGKTLGNKFKIETKFIYNQQSSNEQPIISTWATSYAWFNLYIASNNQLRFYAAGNHTTANPTLTIGNINTVSYSRNDNEWVGTLNGEEVTFTTELTSSNPTTFKILSRGDGTRGSYVSIYRLKLFENNILTMDLIPCYRNSDNVIGMYDIVNNIFYTNSGTGNFTYGSVAPTPECPIPVNVVTGDNEVKVEGKNLLDTSKFTTSTNITNIDVNTSVLNINGNDTNGWAKIFDNLDIPNGNYTIICQILSGTYTGGNLCFFDFNNTQYSFEFNFRTGGNTYNFTLTNGLKQLRIYAPKCSSNVELKIWFVKGTYTSSTIGNYEPYQSQTYPINLGVKNLIDLINFAPVNNNTVVSLIDNGINVNNGSEDGYGAKIQLTDLKANTDYYVSYNWKNISNGTNRVVVFAGTGTSTRLALFSNLNGGTFNTGDNTTINIWFYAKTPGVAEVEYTNIQLEEGTVKHSYTPSWFEPIELCKIGDYQDYIAKSTGKNLFDANNYNLITVYFDENILIGESANKSIYIPCEKNTTYTISKMPSKRFGVAYTTEIPANNVSIYGKIFNHDGNSITITTGNDAVYLIVWLLNGNMAGEITLEQAINTLQIELGSSATTYEPYGKVWYKYSAIGKIVLDGSEEWTVTGTQYTGLFSSYINVLTMKRQNVFSGDLFSNYFTEKAFNIQEEAITKSSAPLTYDFIIFRIGNDKATNMDSWKSWLSTHNTTVYYVLNTPTRTEITDTTLLNQLEAIKLSYNEQTNISQTNADKPFILDVTALKDLDVEDTTPALTTNRELLFMQPPVSENFINDEDDNNILEETTNEEEPNIEDDNKEEEEPLDFFEKEIINNDEEQEEIPTEPIEIDNGQR